MDITKLATRLDWVSRYHSHSGNETLPRPLRRDNPVSVAARCSPQVDEEAIARFRITKDDPRAKPKASTFSSEALVRCCWTVDSLVIVAGIHAYVCVECAGALHHRLPGRLVRALS